MRLTQHTDYAIRVLIYLSLNDRELSTIAQISDAYQISKNHLMKVVQRLASAGYVQSSRGQGGGLRLKLAPEDIILGQVVRDMEPGLTLVECLRPNNNCVITPTCLLPGILNKAVGAFLQELDGYTLKDLLPGKGLKKMKGSLKLVASSVL